MISAEKARELLAGATPGEWQEFASDWDDDGTMTAGYVGVVGEVGFAETELTGGDIPVGDAVIMAAAPDLAETVIAQAEQIERVRALADKWEHSALRWADSLPAPPAVHQLRAALDGTEDQP